MRDRAAKSVTSRPSTSEAGRGAGKPGKRELLLLMKLEEGREEELLLQRQEVPPVLLVGVGRGEGHGKEGGQAP